MYCLLKNTCKHCYKCCSYCKQKCEDRCTDNPKGCKFITNKEPIFLHKFTVNNKEVVCDKDSKRAATKIETNALETRVITNKAKLRKAVKNKIKKKLI